MKPIIMLCVLFMIGCSNRSSEWDSGASRQDAFQQERMEEQSESVRDQNVSPTDPYRGYFVE
jgi:hypothetical protein